MSSPPSPTNPPPPPPSTTAAAATTPPPQPPRKFPAPCWTQEETLALIHAYQDKWYSLRRRNLRTSDWEAVAADVSRRCPDQHPPKTSAQCRHKMEKLRKRYRTEKQRALSLPHNLQARFFSPSSWVFFDLMDAMEAGSTPPQDPSSALLHNTHNNNGSVLRVVHDGNNVNDKVDLADKKGNHKDEFGKYFDEILMGMNSSAHPSTAAAAAAAAAVPVKLKVKNHGFNHLNNHHQNHVAPPHLRHRFDESNHHHHQHDEDDDDDYYDGRNMMMRGPSPGGSSKRKFSGQDYDERFDLFSSKKTLNPNPNPNPTSRGGSGSRARDSVSEMVASIKMLGEGLVRMEKMKMDMMREIEKMRMEMEMKRSEMILESQQLIVNAFVEGFKNNKKIKVLELD